MMGIASKMLEKEFSETALPRVHWLRCPPSASCVDVATNVIRGSRAVRTTRNRGLEYGRFQGVRLDVEGLGSTSRLMETTLEVQSEPKSEGIRKLRGS